MERILSKIRFLAACTLLLILGSIEELKALEGVDKTTINVNGKEYLIVIGEDSFGSRINDIYLLKKALNGDKEAREVFLRGKDERWFYIGDDYPLWIKLTNNSQKVIKPA